MGVTNPLTDWDGPPSDKWIHGRYHFLAVSWKVLPFSMPNLNPNPRFKDERIGNFRPFWKLTSGFFPLTSTRKTHESQQKHLSNATNHLSKARNKPPTNIITITSQASQQTRSTRSAKAFFPLASSNIHGITDSVTNIPQATGCSEDHPI